MLYDINIKSVLNGWIVKVGCQTLVFTDAGHMATQLKLYLDNPKKMEKEYMEKSVNAGKLGHVAITEEPSIEGPPDARDP